MNKLVNYFTFTDNYIFHFLNEKLNCRAFNKMMPYITELGGVVFSLSLPIILILLNLRSSRNIGFEILFSMAYLAVHYPSDVFVGALVGVGTSIVSHSHLFNMFK